MDRLIFAPASICDAGYIKRDDLFEIKSDAFFVLFCT